MAIRERRKGPRFNIHHPVFYFRNYQRREGRSLDVSLDGIKIETDAEVLPNETLDITLAIGESLVKVKGKVVYVEQLPQGRYHVGIAFRDLSPVAQEALTECFSDIMAHGSERPGILKKIE